MFDFSRVNWDKVQDKTIETLIMTFESLIAVFIIGLFLGLLLYLTSNSKSTFGRGFYTVVTAIVNIFRAIPFIILIVLLIPFTKALIGTIIGVQAAIPALIISAAPFYARLVEIGLREV
ncbi:MAG: ABC transporter permease, partial [Gemella haemolysans]|nr:ABC transporter permease [Gemella haemolysans]